MNSQRSYYKENGIHTELLDEVSWADRFMLKSSNRKLPYLLVYGESLMKGCCSVNFFTQQSCAFNLITNGEGIFSTGGRDIPVRAGDMCISSHLQEHNLRVVPGKRLAKIYVGVYYNLLLAQLEPEQNVIRHCAELFAPLFARIKTLLRDGGKEGVDTFAQSVLAYEVVYLILNYFQSEKTTGENEFKKFLHKITQNLGKNHSLESMAHEYNCSLSTIRRLFLKHCEISPMHFLKNARLEYAAYLLCHPDISIRAAMQHCGYRDQSFFTRDFKAHFKITPLAYHKKNMSGNKFVE